MFCRLHWFVVLAVVGGVAAALGSPQPPGSCNRAICVHAIRRASSSRRGGCFRGSGSTMDPALLLPLSMGRRWRNAAKVSPPYHAAQVGEGQRTPAPTSTPLLALCWHRASTIHFGARVPRLLSVDPFGQPQSPRCISLSHPNVQKRLFGRDTIYVATGLCSCGVGIVPASRNVCHAGRSRVVFWHLGL